MFAEGKIFCPHCGQPEIIRFKIGTIRYLDSSYAECRRITAAVAEGYVDHNCPADAPPDAKKKWDY